MLDITTIVFVLSIVVVGVLLTINIRRDFVKRRRLRRDFQRQTDHLRARRRQQAERP
ncbi:MAG: hypothetical protein LC795_03770 [Acidobacteria bacterium]|nr:hypothetical protein [Acidobacteriota bacterium]